jgi:hypothetical protein
MSLWRRGGKKTRALLACGQLRYFCNIARARRIGFGPDEERACTGRCSALLSMFRRRPDVTVSRGRRSNLLTATTTRQRAIPTGDCRELFTRWHDHPRISAPVRLLTSATILPATASMSAPVIVFSRGCRVTDMAIDFLSGAMPASHRCCRDPRCVRRAPGGGARDRSCACGRLRRCFGFSGRSRP